MHCGACIRRVTQALNAMPSTHAEEVRLGHARVQSEQSSSDVAAQLGTAGYPARATQA